MIFYNGSSGSLGRYFAAALARAGLEGRALASRLEDREGLRRELEATTPRGSVTLVQMAARVSVPACEADPEGALRVNVSETRATVETFVRWAEDRGLSAQVVYVSSGHVYAAREPGHRLRETDPTGPRSVYARSKLIAEQELASLANDRVFPLCVARVFGLIAPTQPPNYVLPGLLRRVRDGMLDGIPGLSYARDYLDARDVCAALLRLRATTTSTVVNICSGEPTTLRTMLQEIIRMLFPSKEREILAGVTEAPGRPDDVPWIVGDPSRFESLVGQSTKNIDLVETIRDACANP